MNMLYLAMLELKAIMTNSAVALTVFGGVIFYSFLYPLPYANQTPKQQKISVVNLDKSQASYQLERMVDATPQVKVERRDHSIDAAKDALITHNNNGISGILVIPEHFYKDLLLRKSPVLAYVGDASFFLVYGTIIEGLANAGSTLAAEIKVSHLLTEGVPLAYAVNNISSVKLNMKPTFNASMGYVQYVVPAVFVLILQQTLAMAAGLMGGTQKSGQGYWRRYSSLKVFAIRTLILGSIYVFLSLYYFGVSFEMYGINRLADISTIFAILIPFLLSSCFIGIWLGAILPRRELVTFVVLISSMPLIFSAGVIWPLEIIPSPIIWITSLFPSTAAIQAFVHANQMGASLQQIIDKVLLLWGLTFLWGGLAFLSFKRSISRTNLSAG
ncbi:MAG: ABC-2 type transport system permease protein [Paraglaciecola sp.]|jgi:ABC-2 type transport system permease protein